MRIRSGSLLCNEVPQNPSKNTLTLAGIVTFPAENEIPPLQQFLKRSGNFLQEASRKSPFEIKDHRFRNRLYSDRIVWISSASMASFAEKSLQFHWRKLSPPGFPDQNKVVQIPVEQAQGLETQAVLADLRPVKTSSLPTLTNASQRFGRVGRLSSTK